MVLVLLLLQRVCEGVNMYCADSACSSCSPTYYLYENKSCLSFCPTTYTNLSDQGSVCSRTNSQNLFNIQFSQHLNWIENKISNFSTFNSVRFNASDRSSPIPTADRGFFFNSSSKLWHDKQWWYPAPNFSLRLLYRVLSDGIIFEIINLGIAYFSISQYSGLLETSFILTDSSNFNATTSIYLTATNTWNTLLISSCQQSDVITIRIGDNFNSINSKEFRAQSQYFYWYIGGSLINTSFTGFLWEIIGDNSVITNYNIKYDINNCGYNQYSTSSGCVDCNAMCSTWPWCTASNCNNCFSQRCTECTGFGYSDCINCSNDPLNFTNSGALCKLSLNCATGTSYFNCSMCLNGYELIGLFCLYSLLPSVSTPPEIPSVNIIFSEISESYGGIFMSGNTSSTYSPFNNPQSEDPVFLKNRGLYFNNNFLKTTDILLNYTFTICYWSYLLSNSGTIFSLDSLLINSCKYSLLTLKSSENSINILTETMENALNIWIFASISVSFQQPTTTIVTYLNNRVNSSVSIDGYMFYQNLRLSFLGSNQYSDYFYGYIYTLIIWQISIDASSYYNVCNLGSGISSCLWSCLPNEYYNEIEATCNLCSNYCNSGCSTWGTCSLCLEPNCSICPDLINYNCTAIYKNPCLGSLSLTSGKCCDPSCFDCYDYRSTNCLSCPSGFTVQKFCIASCYNPTTPPTDSCLICASHILAPFCLNTCPDGLIIAGGYCNLDIWNIVNLTFSGILGTLNDSSLSKTFTTGYNRTIYPHGTIWDPIPAKNRGYYFNNTSFMTSDSHLFPFNCTIDIVIKATNFSNGNLLNTSDFSLQAISTGNGNLSIIYSISNTLTCISNSFVTNKWLIIKFITAVSPNGIAYCYISCPQLNIVFHRKSNLVLYNRGWLSRIYI